MRNSLVLVLVITLLTLVGYGQSDSVEENLNAARIKANSGEFQKAKNIYSEILKVVISEKKPSEKHLGRIYYNLGVCNFKMGELAKAENNLSNALRFIKSTDIYFALGLVQIERHNFREGERNFFRAIRGKSNHAESWFEIGLLRFATGKYDEADFAFQKAIRYKSSRRAAAINNLGVIIAIRGDLKKASKKFRKALAISGGKLFEAKENLRFCKLLKRKTWTKTLSLMISRDVKR